ncbi:hypothetical protein ACFFU1_09085 [Algibacter miyuki]|uniref:Uncharacterized protein n=1 Tax=Algibacter miyuki TaxID=1306933 RepID=A0ABV5GZJ3_9FLAO|nr:hypothetical protein [Algibacter miyuki]MDN3666752.1 hypothetical protein [Algibacter miyuki]
MKKVFFVITALFIAIINTSCGSNNDATSEIQYPITMKFSHVDESFSFFKDGLETEVPDDILADYYANTGIARNKVQIEEENKDDYFKFLNATEVEVAQYGETYHVNYIFEGGFLYLYIEDEDDAIIRKFLYGKGNINTFEYLYSSIVLKKENSRSSSSSAYEDEGDIPYFPTTFSNSINFHNYENITDIQGDTYLLIHNLADVFIKE